MLLLKWWPYAMLTMVVCKIKFVCGTPRQYCLVCGSTCSFPVLTTREHKILYVEIWQHLQLCTESSLSVQNCKSSSGEKKKHKNTNTKVHFEKCYHINIQCI